jgi:fatty acid desaturase
MAIEQTQQHVRRPLLRVVPQPRRRATSARTARTLLIAVVVVGTALLAFTFGHALQEFLVRAIVVVALIVVVPVVVWLAIDTLRSLR